MRVALNTNVILSRAIFDSKTIMAALDDISQRHELVLSTYVIDELREVVARKWPGRSYALEDFLQALTYELVVTPWGPKGSLFDIRDPTDYSLLYSAMLADADVLVTGNKDFGDIEVDRPEILTPTERVDRYAGKASASLSRHHTECSERPSNVGDTSPGCSTEKSLPSVVSAVASVSLTWKAKRQEEIGPLGHMTRKTMPHQAKVSMATGR